MDKGRIDPVLKLYSKCPLMLTKNIDVNSGQANGTRILCEYVNVKPGEEPFDLHLNNGVYIKALYALQVGSIDVLHENEDVIPQQFKVFPETTSFNITLCFGDEGNLKTKMKGRQFSVISNSCTTGHKLQGCTVSNILVNQWNYKGNWAYVVLSQVKTMDGLFLRMPLTRKLKKYKCQNA